MTQTYTIGPESGSQEWHAARMHSIGASEAAAAVGLSDYAQPWNVYAEKTGLVEGFKGNVATRCGQALEPEILRMYGEETGVTLERCLPMMVSKEFPFISATPDAFFHTFAGSVCVDAKNCGWRMREKFGPPGTDQVPPSMLIQMQQQMLVTGANRVDIAVLFECRDLKIYTVLRNEKLIAGLIERLTELWQRVQNRDPPLIDVTHPFAMEVIKEAYVPVEGLSVGIETRIEEVWDRYQGLRRTINHLDKEAKVLKAEVFAHMGTAEIGILPNGKTELKRSLTKMLITERKVRDDGK